MAGDFTKNFDPGKEVQWTMQRVFENTELLRNSWAGYNPAGEHGQVWYDATNAILKVKGPGGEEGWTKLANLSSSEIILSDGNVKSENISDDARKGTIVKGEAIAPTSCTIRGGSSILPCQAVSIPGNTNYSFKATIAYGTKTVTMYVRGQSGTAKFTLAGKTSGTASVGASWGSASVVLSGEISGIKDLNITFTGGTVYAICFGTGD